MTKKLVLSRKMVIFSFLLFSCENKEKINFLMDDLKDDSAFFLEEYKNYSSLIEVKLRDHGQDYNSSGYKFISDKIFIIDRLIISGKKTSEIDKVLGELNKKFDFKIEKIDDNVFEKLNVKEKKIYSKYISNKLKYILVKRFYYRKCKGIY